MILDTFPLAGTWAVNAEGAALVPKMEQVVHTAAEQSSEAVEVKGP